MNTDDQFRTVSGIALLIIGSFCLYVWWVASSIGADFQVTMKAVILSTLSLVLGVAAYFVLKPRVSTLIVFTLIPLSRSWWGVMDNVVEKIQSASDMPFSEPPPIPFWTTSWFKYGSFGLIVLLWLLLLAIPRNENNDYSRW